jgi:hypothetical protein
VARGLTGDRGWRARQHVQVVDAQRCAAYGAGDAE